ncbi:hypothetical protein IKE71_04240 [Candidatus Saccharibacteria bacterium]|nr:hypothetical protein [Candidatus Saccharibacteria bacterium]
MSEMHISWIPKEEIVERYSRIKPVAKKDGKLYWLRPFDEGELFNISYLWDDETEEQVQDGEIVPIPDKDFRCLHKYGYYGLFKPSVAEVLTQIDSELLGTVVAFEIIDSPETAEDFYRDEFTSTAFNSGYHVSTVRLYKLP